MKKHAVVFTLIVSLIIPLSSNAAAPLDTIRAEINKVLDVLRDQSLKGESGKKAKKTKIRSIANGMFDFDELSRRTLGKNWSKLNDGQQKEFVDLYSSLLEETYANKILSYTNEKVLYGKETNLTEKTVEVQTTIVTKKADIPVNYRLIQKASQWKVYDVVIEGVSLISNYRAQFGEILIGKSAEALLDSLRKKVGDKG
ncbi:MAG: ABC transporter substrate-binding protein [Nitrospirota bacterium]